MKVELKSREFEAFQFQRHTFEELPLFAQRYSAKHGVTIAKLYRHATQCKLYVPFDGGFMPVSSGEWLLHDGEHILVVTDADFKRRYKVVTDPADAYPPELIFEHTDDDRG